MGWHVNVGLSDAARNVDLFPCNSLGWLLAAEAWNHWAWEAVTDGNDWEEAGLPDDEWPTNCEWDDFTTNDPPTIKIPNFDKQQQLKI